MSGWLVAGVVSVAAAAGLIAATARLVLTARPPAWRPPTIPPLWLGVVTVAIAAREGAVATSTVVWGRWMLVAVIAGLSAIAGWIGSGRALGALAGAATAQIEALRLAPGERRRLVIVELAPTLFQTTWRTVGRAFTELAGLVVVGGATSAGVDGGIAVAAAPPDIEWVWVVGLGLSGVVASVLGGTRR